MKRIIIILSMLTIILSASEIKADTAPAPAMDQIPIKVDPIRDNNPNLPPRMPQYVPVKAYLIGDILTVTCEYEVSGKAEVTDNQIGGVVAEEYVESTSLITMELPEYHAGMMELRLELNGVNYIGYF